jgi:hypothetical protein
MLSCSWSIYKYKSFVLVGCVFFAMFSWSSLVYNGRDIFYDVNKRFVEMFGCKYIKCILKYFKTDTEVITYFDLFARKT